VHTLDANDNQTMAPNEPFPSLQQKIHICMGTVLVSLQLAKESHRWRARMVLKDGAPGSDLSSSSLASHPSPLAFAANELAAIKADIDRAFNGSRRLLAKVPASRRSSVTNLIAYLAMRGRDLRGLQSCLAELGLSSLGRAEAHVQQSLGAVAWAWSVVTGAHRQILLKAIRASICPTHLCPTRR
jgi:hypothetical protein